MAIPLFNSREFLTTINGYTLKDSDDNILEIGVPAHELEETDVGERLVVYKQGKPDLDFIKTIETLLACVADINARLVVLEDTIAFL